MDALGSTSGQLYLSGRSDRISQLGHISLSDGKNNSAIGLGAGTSVKNGANNIFLGAYSGANAIASGSVFLGALAGQNATRIRNSVFLGSQAGQYADRVDSSVVIGVDAGRKMTRANCNTVLGYQAGAELTSGSRNTVLGTYAAYSQFNGTDNVCVGHQAGYKNRVGSNNCYVGTNSGFSAINGTENVCLGVSSGEMLYAGAKNVLCGYRAGANITNSSNCIAIGTRAMEFFFDGDTNTCLGTETAKYFSGINNTILGGYSTANASGNFNTIIGSRSMNRATRERVNLSNCVIVGENIQFDIPIRLVEAGVPSLDLTPDAQTPDTSTLTLTDTNDDNSRAYLEINVVPVGDPVLIRSRYISLGTPETPVIFDTSAPGSYVVRWGSAPAENLDLLDPIPVAWTLDVDGDLEIVLSLHSYGDLVFAQSFDPAPTFQLFAEQSFDPPTITLRAQAQEFSFSPPLPGARIIIDPSPIIDSTLVTVFATGNVSITKGQAIQVLDASIPQVNGVWRILEAVETEDGDTAISFRVSQAPNIRTTPYLGPDVRVLASRVVSAHNVTGTPSNGKVQVTLPQFAGMLFDTAIKVLADDVVRDITVIDKYAGTFEFAAQSGDIADIRIGSFEPLIVGFDADATGLHKSIGDFVVKYAQRSDKGVQTTTLEGPTSTDGHSHRGAGTQAQLDADISDGKLTFVDGLSFADYTIGTANSNVSTTATFEITNDGDIGIQWLDWYTITCSVSGNAFGTTLGYSGSGTRELANVTPSEVYVAGDLSMSGEPTLPVNLADFEKPFTITIAVEHRIRLRELDVDIRISSDEKFVTLSLEFRNAPPVSSTSSLVSFFATKPTTVSAVRIQNTNYQLYPSFSDCIFLGSNFTVGSQLPLDEKANVFVAAIGNVPLFKGTTEEFTFFSNAVTLNETTVSELTVDGDANVSGQFTGFSVSLSDTLSVAGAVDLGDDLVVAGNMEVSDVTVNGTANIGENLVVSGTVTVESSTTLASLDVSGDASFVGVQIDTLDVTGATTLGDDLTVSGDTIVQGFHAASAVLENDLTVGGDFSVQGTLAGDSISLKSGSSEVTLDVNDLFYGNMKVSGTSVGGWDGIRFEDSQMILAFRDAQSGFYHEDNGWQLYINQGSLYVRNNLVAYHSFSDARLKTNLRPFDSLDLVKKMPAYEFEWKAGGATEIGLIAQDVQGVLPWAVKSSHQTNDNLVVDYSKVVPVLVDAIAKLEKRVAELESLVQ